MDGDVSRDIVRALRRVGRDLVAAGLVTTHGGNLSVRVGSDLIVTRRGARLGYLTATDVVRVAVATPAPQDGLASTELPTHRAIYQQTAAAAVVHAHPVTAVALSLTQGEIVPVDVEGLFILGKVPVIDAEYVVGSPAVAAAVAATLIVSPIAVFKGHGSFAIGRDIDEALHLTSTLEASAQIVRLHAGARARSGRTV